MPDPKGRRTPPEANSLVAELKAQATAELRHGFVSIGLAALTVGVGAVLHPGTGIVGLVFPGTEVSPPVGLALRLGALLFGGISIYFLREASRSFAMWRTKNAEVVNAMVLEASGQRLAKARKFLEVLRGRLGKISTAEPKDASISIGEIILAIVQVLASRLLRARKGLPEPRQIALPPADRDTSEAAESPTTPPPTPPQP